ncbi:MAG: M17 family peptidase N-terminal domain-containing protein [Ignavibacteriaceae bacterium]
MFRISFKSGAEIVSFTSFSCVVYYLAEDKNLKENLSAFEKKFRIKLSELNRQNILNKKNNQITVTNQKGKPDTIILHKYKVDDKFSVDHFRNHLAGLIKDLQKDEIKSLHIFTPKFDSLKIYFDDEEYYYRTFMEGISLGNYRFDKYKKEKEKVQNLSVVIYSENERILKSAIAKNKMVIDGISFTNGW